jgi:hypothetical protein
MDEDRLIEKRTQELKAHHSFRHDVAETVATIEVGYSFAGAASRLDVAESTIKGRVEHVEDEVGHNAVMVRNSPEEMTGPLSPMPNLRTCPHPECGLDRVVSLREAERVFPTKSQELRDALDAAEATGSTHVCVSCGEVFTDHSADDYAVSLPDVATELFEYDQWVARRKSDKKPVAPWTTGDVSPANAAAFFNQTSVRTVLEWESKLAGTPDAIAPGFYLTDADPYVAVDLDDCRDAENGALTDFARETMDTLGGYAEVSPSGTGVHVIVRGELPSNVRTKGIEMYERKQYVTMSFDHLDGTPTEPVDAQGALDELWDEHGGELPEPPSEREYADGDGPEGPLYNTPITELCDCTPGVKHSHPVHGSSTGENFKVYPDDPTVFYCFRCKAAGNTCHLLAMEYVWRIEDVPQASIQCAEVRRRWKRDDAFVANVWAWAVEQDYIAGSSVPNRVDPALIDGGE